MSPGERLLLVDCADPLLSIVEQCRLLKVARSTLYYRASPVSADDLAVMRRMDELYLTAPFYGSRRMVAVLRRDGWSVNRKRVRRLMRLMGLEAIYQKPNTSRRHPEHKVYPYLLRSLVIERPNQVWCADITYIPMARGFVYLVAVMDWFSRRVLAWRLSIGMETEFCVEALQEAMDRHGQPEVFNTDQGVQFTSADFLAELVIKAYSSVPEARRGIAAWLAFYNDERPHQALGYLTPRAVFDGAAACGYMDNAAVSLRFTLALPTSPQAHQKQECID
jgi:putative transposase